MNKLYNLFIFNSLKAKLQAAFTAFSGIVCLILATFFWYYYKNQQIQDIVSIIVNIHLETKDLHIHQRDFQLYERTNANFFRTQESRFLNKHHQVVELLKSNLHKLSLKPDIRHTFVENEINQVAIKIDKLTNLFNRLVKLYLERGLKDYGLEGKMRAYIHLIEKNKNINTEKVLMLRRTEKDFFLRKEEKYVENLTKGVKQLIKDISKTPNAVENINMLENYQKIFLEIVKVEQQIGLGNTTGISQQLDLEIEKVENEINSIKNKTLELAETRNQQVAYTLLALLVSNIFLTILLMVFVVRKLSRPINRLSTSIHQVIQSNFAPNSQIVLIDKRDEVGRLSQDVRLMLDKIKERGAELTKQNTKLTISQQSIKKLSEIGQKIIGSLNEQKIIDTVFYNLNNLINNTVVAIGMYDKDNNCLWFAGNEDGQQRYAIDNLSDDTLLSTWCFENQMPIVMADAMQEYQTYLPKVTLPPANVPLNSFVYLPLSTPEKNLGVITMQHTNKNAYNSFHIDILANVATYTAIALQNARAYQKIEVQKQEILEKSELVTESILYAKQIQDAMLVSLARIRNVLPHSFVLFKPKDLVSGDFYFFAEIKYRDNSKKTQQKIAVAAVDCTGHGVPGAFMSMAGHNLLNGIIVQNAVTSPDVVLLKLHRAIKNTFQKNEITSRDGMDISLIIIDKVNKVVEFAGAKNPLIYFDETGINEIKGDIRPIGGEFKQFKKGYTKHTINVQNDTTFYLFSDGYRDQFGGENGKKFTSSKFKQLLTDMQPHSLEQQQQILEQTLEAWMAEAHETQLDDVLVIGIKISPETVQ